MLTRREKPRRFGIRFKFAVLIGALIVALMVVDALWNIDLQQQQAENEAREKAEVLADQMHAMWDFIDINQNIVNRNEDGTFRTKTLVCVVAAKSVSMLFTSQTDYTIRFTSQTPRQAANAADAFEERAFEAFASDPTLEAYYDVETNEAGQRVFRYLEPLYVTETVPGMPRRPEGGTGPVRLREGGHARRRDRRRDVHHRAHGHLRATACSTSVFAAGVHRCCSCWRWPRIGIYAAVSRLVLRPIDGAGRAAEQIGEGDFAYRRWP